MAKIKHTKTELKAQKDALSRFQKFLPMLQLKKQQLQAEIVAIRAKVEVIREAIREGEAAMEPWLAPLAGEGA
ncbi:MAG: V-type ATP synthase subunit D, partial [Kiritimatiellaeota bacterium]|nr:V-type ATP synthase subunit D [Kiritimatiellota bacterium]